MQGVFIKINQLRIELAKSFEWRCFYIAYQPTFFLKEASISIIKFHEYFSKQQMESWMEFCGDDLCDGGGECDERVECLGVAWAYQIGGEAWWDFSSAEFIIKGESFSVAGGISCGCGFCGERGWGGV